MGPGGWGQGGRDQALWAQGAGVRVGGIRPCGPKGLGPGWEASGPVGPGGWGLGRRYRGPVGPRAWVGGTCTGPVGPHLRFSGLLACPATDVIGPHRPYPIPAEFSVPIPNTVVVFVPTTSIDTCREAFTHTQCLYISVSLGPWTRYIFASDWLPLRVSLGPEAPVTQPGSRGVGGGSRFCSHRSPPLGPDPLTRSA